MGNWRHKKKSAMYRIRKRNIGMNFSYEEIYSMYGQYDTFVSLEFKYGSDAYEKFGESLMGTFKYTLEQRENLEEKLSSKKIPRSSKRITFEPSSLYDKLTEEQKIYLDKTGIKNADICCISSYNKPRQNTFAQKGEKDISNQMEIKINWNAKDTYLVALGLYKTRLHNGEILTDIEKNHYYALRLYFEQDTLTKEENKFIFDEQTKEIKPTIREKYLDIKWEVEGKLSKEENEEIKELWHLQWENNKNILKKEIQRSGNTLKELPVKLQMELIVMSCSFKGEVLLPYIKPAIWWNIERFLHIFIRHFADLQPDGNFKNKTVFQYKYKDIKRVICNVIKSIEKEIEEWFKNNPDKTFKRIGKQSVYYNGNYYRVDIEPSGKLLTFHPYNDDKERENDTK
jgi:hypothetical protein